MDSGGTHQISKCEEVSRANLNEFVDQAVELYLRKKTLPIDLTVAEDVQDQQKLELTRKEKQELKAALASLNTNPNRDKVAKSLGVKTYVTNQKIAEMMAEYADIVFKILPTQAKIVEAGSSEIEGLTFLQFRRREVKRLSFRVHTLPGFCCQA